MIDQLAVLVGKWSMESKKLAGRGRTTVEEYENGKFVRLRSSEEQERFPASTWIIGADDSTGDFACLYYDSRSVRRVYRMSVSDGVWMIWRDAPGFNQRFIGNIAGDGKSITGQWEFSRDGTNWQVDFDLTYRRIEA